ncbi:hypothetical protein [Pontibacter ramchanderi]|uniref:DKNYY family protein n=1 Tax=Pontibacter ramchanderi TaxID=1179743 RepID=A0A2N3V474_9BACT|nr:hypothetical protein [Pontibacter ramchanderi]PKV76432.1 hypothetical protein BD749_1385 [Pontibacter ramchanderi]
MRKSFAYLKLVFLFNLLPFTIFAQTDTSFVGSAVDDALKQYKTAIGVHAHLYNGTEYFVPVKSYVKGHQFYQDKVYQNGTVKYDGAWFKEVPMLYDLMQDELIIVNHGSGQPQRLVKNRIESFKLHGHTFVRIEPDSTTGLSIQSGFYDLLYSGETQVLMKREKTLFERASTEGMEGEYRDASKFYLVKDGIYHPVSNKRSVMRVLRDQKKPLNKFAKANRLRFKKEREYAIRKTAEHYDTLRQ